MSDSLAIGLGVASAALYGAASVFQHDAVHRSDGGGEVDAYGLMKAIRSPRWLIGAGGDVFGFILQAAAVTIGSVVLVQPLVPLMLPVALFVGYLVGGPRPRAADYAACALIGGGLAGFLTLMGTPAVGSVPSAKRVATFVVLLLIAGAVGAMAATGHHVLVRAAVYGTVGGVYFGTLGVMVDAISEQWKRHGLVELVTSPRGLMPLFGAAVLGLGGVLLTQLSYQVGALAATLPANLSADPLAGIVLGGVLLGENIPSGAGHLAGYAACLAVVVLGAVRLAQRSAADTPPPTAPATQPG